MLETFEKRPLKLMRYTQVFLGQIMGTSVGTQVFVKYGWRPAAALSVAWSGFTLVVMLLRGPHCSRYTWFGYEGGLRLRKEAQSAPTPTAEKMPAATGSKADIGSQLEGGAAVRNDAQDTVSVPA